MADRKRRGRGREPEAVPPGVEEPEIDQPEIVAEPEVALEPEVATEPPSAIREGPVRPARIRGRLVAVVALAVAVALVGVVLEDQIGAREPAAGSPGATLSGAWFCPHGGGSHERAWVAVTNPGTRPVRVRFTTLGSRGVVSRQTQVVPPSTQLYRAVPAKRAGDATEVEYFGGWVGAGWITRRAEPEPSLAASRCAGSPSLSWYMPDVPTGRGQRASVVVMNPFGEDAAVDVIIRTDRRAAVRPGTLSPLVVPAGTSTAIELNTYLLQSPDERVVSVELRAEIGRVAAAAVDTSTAGVATEIGVADTASRWNLPVAGVTGPSMLTLLNPESRRSDLTVITQSDHEQRVVSGVDGLSVGPETAGAYVVRSADAAGVGVEATNRSEIAVQRRVMGSNGDPALVGPAPFARERWLLLPVLPPGGGLATLVVQNPGKQRADVQIELLGSNGHLSAAASDVSVPAGRATIIDLTALSEGKPVSALVTAVEGTIVVGGASFGAGDAGFAATLALPVPEAP